MLLLLIYSVLGLTKNELPARCVVAKVKPVENTGLQDPFVDGAPSFAGVDTPNYKINLRVFGYLLYLCLHTLPVQTPEEVDPVCQDNGFGETNLCSAERLAHTVGLADRLGIDQGYV
jgi:hypothetical protein